MNRRTYTDSDLIENVKKSTSIRQVLILLGLASQGGSYAGVKKHIKKLGIDTSHFTGKGWSKGKLCPPKRDIEDYLSNKFPISSFKLKLRLLKEDRLIPKCSRCGLTEWLDSPIPLELDHIDGNHSNNQLDNLRLLCPNCHALTPTHAGKNKGRSCSTI